MSAMAAYGLSANIFRLGMNRFAKSPSGKFGFMNESLQVGGA